MSLKMANEENWLVGFAKKRNVLSKNIRAASGQKDGELARKDPWNVEGELINEIQDFVNVRLAALESSGLAEGFADLSFKLTKRWTSRHDESGSEWTQTASMTESFGSGSCRTISMETGPLEWTDKEAAWERLASRILEAMTLRTAGARCGASEAMEEAAELSETPPQCKEKRGKRL